MCAHAPPAVQWWWVGYQNCYLPCAAAADDVAGECGVSVNGAGVCSSITQTEQVGAVLAEQGFPCCWGTPVAEGRGGEP